MQIACEKNGQPDQIDRDVWLCSILQTDSEAKLTPWESGFVNSVSQQAQRRGLSLRQQEILVRIAAERCPQFLVDEVLAEHEREQRDAIYARNAVPKPDPVRLARLHELFVAFGEKHTKRGVLFMEDGIRVRVTQRKTRPAERRPALYLSNGRSFDQNVYYGLVDAEGNLEPRKECDSGILAFLNKIAVDPVAEAARMGKLTGICMFCSRTLTDDQSRAVGYGPVCAKSFQMPWGHAHV